MKYVKLLIINRQVIYVPSVKNGKYKQVYHYVQLFLTFQLLLML